MANKAINSTILKYYDTKLKAWIAVEDGKILESAKTYAKDYADGINEAAQDGLDDLAADIGNLENLETTSKSDLVSALNEVKESPLPRHVICPAD